MNKLQKFSPYLHACYCTGANIFVHIENNRIVGAGTFQYPGWISYTEYKNNRGKLNQIQNTRARLDILFKLHGESLLIGWAAENKHNSDDIIALPGIENRGRYGIVPGVYIYEKNTGAPWSAMTIEQAYKYANLGGSIINARAFMARLGWD